MNRAEAYAILTAELEHWRRLPFSELVSFVGASPFRTSVPVGAESIELEVYIKWEKPHAIRIEAIANGPSCWKLERLEEVIIVFAQAPSVDV
ncbi:MAG: hypothetical protein LBB76_06620 [Azoarcus sp.]|jgi:hypothetical protein|nr:hypothetical protein [Azoarcus sp.]